MLTVVFYLALLVFLFPYVYIFVVPVYEHFFKGSGMEPRTLHMQDKCSIPLSCFPTPCIFGSTHYCLRAAKLAT